jgi:hypothetical protein
MVTIPSKCLKHEIILHLGVCSNKILYQPSKDRFRVCGFEWEMAFGMFSYSPVRASCGEAKELSSGQTVGQVEQVRSPGMAVILRCAW